MRVLFVASSSVYDSPATLARLVAWAEGFQRNKVEVYLFYTGPRTLDITDVFTEVRHASINYDSIASRILWRATLAFGLTRFAADIGIRDGDFVWAVEREVVGLECSLLLSRNTGALAVHELTEHPAVLQTVAGRYRRFYIERRYLKSVAFIPVISKALAKYCRQHSNSQVHLTGPIIGLDAGSEANARPSVGRQDGQSITYAGSLSEGKDGVVTLVECFEQVKSTAVGENAVLDIFGGGTAGEVEALVARAKSSAFADSIRVHGQVDSGQLAAALQEASVLVMPRPRSTQADHGFPTKLAEYLVSGIPVVATNVSDVGCRVQDRVEALIVDPGDIQGLSEAILKLLDDRSYAADIGQAGRQLVLDNWAAEQVAKRLLLEARRGRCCE